MNEHTTKTIAEVQGWMSPEQESGEGPPASQGRLGNNGIGSGRDNSGGGDMYGCFLCTRPSAKHSTWFIPFNTDVNSTGKSALQTGAPGSWPRSQRSPETPMSFEGLFFFRWTTPSLTGLVLNTIQMTDLFFSPS